MDFIIEKVRRSEHSIYLHDDGSNLHLVVDNRNAIVLYRDGEMRVDEGALSDAGINVKIEKDARKK